ncbi:ejaculatory bulb-specific protein 3-like [Cloeon dipterum]|uniref:ejaculatory bulb-specific protein 3-like n=1 Tax=Cloeon dipterum TaxID=197152 RepID=UPI00321FF984
MVHMQVLLFVVLAAVAAVAQEPPGKYSIKFDGINLEDILRDNNRFLPYIKCLMDQGRCTPDGNELKRTMADEFQTDCAKCSQKQKAAVDMVINFLIKNRQHEWNNLIKKFDPNGEYQKRHEANLNRN